MSDNSFNINNTNTSAIRKIRKPLMEKKRRARINDSLEALKDILLKNTVAITYGQRPTKLEKADILEMTVRYLNTLHKRLATQRTYTNHDCGVSSTTASSETIQMKAGNPFALSKTSGNFRRRIASVKKHSENDKENVVPTAAVTSRTKSSSNSFKSSSQSAFTAIHPNVASRVRKMAMTDTDDPWRPW